MANIGKRLSAANIGLLRALGMAIFVCAGLTFVACSGQQQKAGSHEMAMGSSAEAMPAASAQDEPGHAPGHSVSEAQGERYDAKADHTGKPDIHIHTEPHQDHNSKHGGAFFMALDEQHHLEGVLVSPGIFRVFLYDQYSRPVSKSDLSGAVAKVTWGRQDGAPVTIMKPSSDGSALEAPSPSQLTLPAELTLVIRFPGAPANSRPELFTFPFAKFTGEQTKHKD